jgi:Helicase conserved C-terminal domain
MVSVEAATTRQFQLWLHEMCSNRRLARIVVDEAHRAIQDESYREVFNELDRIRIATTVPIVLLSATVPPSCEKQLMAKFRCHIFDTVRLPTNRPNLAYSFYRTPKAKYFTQIARYFHEKLVKHGSGYRAIVFCRTKMGSHDGVDPLAEYLTTYLSREGITEQVSAYYSDKENKEEEFDQWAKRKTRIIVATTALGAGIHFEDIRDVVHCGLSSSVVEFVQETGRGGRDGLPCNAVTYYDTTDTMKPPPVSQDVFGARIMKTVASSKVCRRFHVTDLLDGYPTDCISCGGALCDICNGEYESQRDPPLRPAYVDDRRLKEQGPLLPPPIEPVPIPQQTGENRQDSPVELEYSPRSLGRQTPLGERIERTYAGKLRSHNRPRQEEMGRGNRRDNLGKAPSPKVRDSGRYDPPERDEGHPRRKRKQPSPEYISSSEDEWENDIEGTRNRKAQLVKRIKTHDRADNADKNEVCSKFLIIFQMLN